MDNRVWVSYQLSHLCIYSKVVSCTFIFLSCSLSKDQDKKLGCYDLQARLTFGHGALCFYLGSVLKHRLRTLCVSQLICYSFSITAGKNAISLFPLLLAVLLSAVSYFLICLTASASVCLSITFINLCLCQAACMRCIIIGLLCSYSGTCTFVFHLVCLPVTLLSLPSYCT